MAEKNTTTIAGRKTKQSLKFQRDKDKEPVKGIFHYHEVPGGTLSFFYKKYKGDQPERYKLKDQEVVTLPIGVAKHLNKNGWYPIHVHAQDSTGKSVYRIGEKKRRFGFQSLEFVDPEDFSTVDPGIITVETV